MNEVSSALTLEAGVEMSDAPFGYVTQIIGPVIDIAFPEGYLPLINHAIRIESSGQPDIIVEVQQQLDNGAVRCVAMSPTEGLARHESRRHGRRPSPCLLAIRCSAGC